MREIIEEINDLVENVEITPDQAMEILKIKELRKISEALELIEVHMTDLDECVTNTQHGSFLCITGNVTNYEG